MVLNFLYADSSLTKIKITKIKSLKRHRSSFKSQTLTLILRIGNVTSKEINLTFGVMHVILVIVDPTEIQFTAFDDLNRVVLAVPPTAHDARADLQGKHGHLPLLQHFRLHRYLDYRRCKSVACGGFLVALRHGYMNSGAILCARRCLYGTHRRWLLRQGSAKSRIKQNMA